jgi:hypothetical protein
MVTGIALILCIAFCLLYNTSKKMTGVGVLGFEKWADNHRNISQYLGLGLMTVSLLLSCWIWGLGSGTFTFFVLLMTIASLVVLLAPLRLISYATIGGSVVFFLICELVLF